MRHKTQTEFEIVRIDRIHRQQETVVVAVERGWIEIHIRAEEDRRHVQTRPVHLPPEPPAKGFFHISTVTTQIAKRRTARDDQK
jgi:hypothetical protein